MLGKVAKSTRRHWSARRDENSDSVITREWYRTVGVVSSPVASMQRARGPPWDCERGERKGERGVRGQLRVLGAVFPRSALATRTRRAGGYRAQNTGAREAAGRGISRGERGSGRERREAVGARAHPHPGGFLASPRTGTDSSTRTVRGIVRVVASFSI
jgi:hypothetical protein